MAVGTIYIDTTGSATNSGTNDGAAIVSGSAATAITTTITLDASTDLSGVATDGSVAIYLSQATNSTQKIFWITGSAGSSGATPTVTVSVAPSGITSSAWTIGGRMVYTSANFESALRAGDTVQFNNTPATKSSVFFTARVAGDSTTGYINLVGKTGVRPVLETTGNNNVLSMAQNNWFVSNLELKTNGTSAAIINIQGSTYSNLKITTVTGASQAGILSGGGGNVIIGCEITGTTLIGVSLGNAQESFVCGNYIHDLTAGDGINLSGASANQTIISNIIDTVAGRGIYLSGASTTQLQVANIWGNTIYNATLAGIEVTDTDTKVMLYNNIVMNTNTSDIVKWAAGNAQLVSSHGYNLFYSSSSGVLNGLTANSTEISGSDPLFTDAPNGNFTLQSTSPAKATGFPGLLLGGTNTGYLDIGALQRVEPTAGIISVIGS